MSERRDEAVVVRTTGLTKKYGELTAVDEIDLKIVAGSVYGLLGPNGAGKTSIIGMLLGLLRPSGGSVFLFGKEVGHRHDAEVRRMGAIMETPAFYPFLSGRDNLRYFQGIAGQKDDGEIDRLLGVVGLTDRADARFTTYSLGMKHRLGIAYSLLGDPELLLLDEPTNGLDPYGMAEVRELIRELGAGDRTIVLASHLLHEVEQVCDSVAIISKGVLVAQGPVRDLIGRQDRVRLTTTNDDESVRVLAGLDWTGEVTVVPDGGLVVSADPSRAWELSRALAERGIFVGQMVSEETSLEEYFLDVTSLDEGGEEEAR